MVVPSPSSTTPQCPSSVYRKATSPDRHGRRHVAVRAILCGTRALRSRRRRQRPCCRGCRRAALRRRSAAAPRPRWRRDRADSARDPASSGNWFPLRPPGATKIGATSWAGASRVSCAARSAGCGAAGGHDGQGSSLSYLGRADPSRSPSDCTPLEHLAGAQFDQPPRRGRPDGDRIGTVAFGADARVPSTANTPAMSDTFDHRSDATAPTGTEHPPPAYAAPPARPRPRGGSARDQGTPAAPAARGRPHGTATATRPARAPAACRSRRTPR